MKRKSRKQKSDEYVKKYGNIPLGYEDRINYLYDVYNLDNKPELVQDILDTRNNIIDNLFYYDLNIVSLYEEPEGTGRPRFRLINRKNFHIEAMNAGQFVQVYTLGAAEDQLYMKKLSNEGLYELNGLIHTPVNIEYHVYFKTPSYYNAKNVMLAEIGLKRPSFKKPDVDNIEKKYMDMYNYNVWLDDATVNRAVVEKYYSVLPRVEIRLRYLNCVYDKVQAKNISKRKDFDKSTKPLFYLDNSGNITTL